ncbi:MAG TPA: ISL3 family transposase [Actinomycetes bacterium]
MRVTTAFNRLLSLPGAGVTEVCFEADQVVVDVALRRRRLLCPECTFSTAACYDTRPVFSRWRHTDMGRWKVLVRAGLRRLDCPTHGIRVEAVPFARHRSGFSRDFEDLIAFLATKTDKTTIVRLSRVDWDSVGRICERVVADGLDPGRLDGLVSIGVDEVSWRKHHRYLTLVTDHRGKKIVWGAEGKDTATLDAFFDELGETRSAALQAVSMDMGPAFLKSVRAEGHAPQAVICIDPFHAVKLVTDALDVVRRQTWNQLRQLPDQAAAKKFKGARWSLLKRPENLTCDQAATLRQLRNRGGDLWRAYSLKEAFRAIFSGDLTPDETIELIARWCSKASRSRLAPFVKVAKTIRKHHDGILAAIRLKINNARAEGLNNHVRLIIRRAYGFHSPTAALALVMLSCGPIDLVLPHERAAA